MCDNVLKRILLNHRSVPVPVPLKDLGQAMAWLENSMVPAGSCITKVTLNDRDIDYDGGFINPRDAATALSALSNLIVRIDSLASLSSQTLDTIHSLAAAVLGTLKSVAVHTWQVKAGAKVPELVVVHDDIKLIVGLICHAHGLLAAASESGILDTGPVSGIGHLLEQNLKSHALAMQQCDWKACARILLNRFEPLLKDLITEAETLQLRVLAIQPQLELSPGQGGCGTIDDIASIRHVVAPK